MVSLMPDAELQFSLSKVKNAGKILRDQEPGSMEYDDALEVFANWRKVHSVILNQFYDSLQEYVRTKSRLTYVVNRPKRIDAVIKKLRRDYPRAQLSTMQDIAGCRAVVKAIDDVDPLVEACKEIWSEHTLLDPPDDYINKPNPKTGYRGIHLVYKFKSDNPSFNGRFVEVQIRTREQHAWATAVETVDLVQGDSLKSGHGDLQWQRFFSLMGSAIAYRESSPFVPNTPLDARELESELRRYQKLLQVAERLQLYSAIARIIEPPSAITVSGAGDRDWVWFFLLELDIASSETILTPYKESDIAEAYRHMAASEKAGKNVVLAGAHSFEQLKEGYPNWFIDTHNFLRILKAILGEDVTLY